MNGNHSIVAVDFISIVDKLYYVILKVDSLYSFIVNVISTQMEIIPYFILNAIQELLFIVIVINFKVFITFVAIFREFQLFIILILLPSYINHYLSNNYVYVVYGFEVLMKLKVYLQE